MSAASIPILLVGDTLQLGGTEGQFVEIASRLSRSRWDLHVACISAEGPLRSRLETAGLRPWSCGPRSFKSLGVVATLARLVRYVRAHGIRLVHAFDFYSNLVGVLAGRLAGGPVVIASQRDLGNLRHPLQQRIHRVMLRLADLVLVNTEAVVERLARELPGVARRVVLVPNGVDLTRFSPPKRLPRETRGQVVVGTLANLRAEKGLEDFVRAAADVRKRCATARFVIWGDGPLRGDLERLIRAERLDSVVDLRGPTAQPETALRGLDLFVLPSRSEACSNVLLEAMATRLGVVATRVGGNPWLVQDEATGLLVPPGDPVALAKALIRLIEEPELAGRLADGALERVRSHFSRETMLERIGAVYERALAGGAA